MNQQFSFHRLRYHFAALEPVRFPRGMAANTVRGALGWALHGASDEVYRSLFEPKQEGGTGPSGLGDLPRPFVLRASHLNGCAFEVGGEFHLDVHVFSVEAAPLARFVEAFEKVAARGFASTGTSGKCRFTGVESLDLAGAVREEVGECTVALESASSVLESISIRFITPTELKVAGALARLPEFPVLFARVRDRVRSLCSLYGTEIEMDFDGMTERAARVVLVSNDLVWEKVERTSRKTGQTHPLGGFQGTARYEGEIGEFVPLLHAARWTGVGRQTVWGKGEIEVS